MTTNPRAAGGAQSAPAEPVARAIPAEALYREIEALGITHVLTVPDTHQKSLLAHIAKVGRPRLLTCCTEDEAIAINAGLYCGHQRPMLLIQNTGFFASMNALRGIAGDAQIPTFLLIGQFGRDVRRTSAENRASNVRLIEPVLDVVGVPYYTLEAPEDLPKVAEAYRVCQERRGPVVVLVGAPTS